MTPKFTSPLYRDVKHKSPLLVEMKINIASFSGKGTIIYENGDRYISGEGTIIYENGDKYEGDFQRCMPHGEGLMIYQNGQVCGGIWKDGELVEDVSVDADTGIGSSSGNAMVRCFKTNKEEQEDAAKRVEEGRSMSADTDTDMNDDLQLVVNMMNRHDEQLTQSRELFEEQEQEVDDFMERMRRHEQLTLQETQEVDDFMESIL